MAHHSKLTQQRFYTTKQVADLLGISEKTLRRRIEEGRLPSHRIGRLVRISDADLNAYVAIHRRAVMST